MGANSNPCFIFSSQSSRFFTNILLIKLFKLIDTAELLDIPAVQWTSNSLPSLDAFIAKFKISRAILSLKISES